MKKAVGAYKCNLNKILRLLPCICVLMSCFIFRKLNLIPYYRHYFISALGLKMRVWESWLELIINNLMDDVNAAKDGVIISQREK